MNKSDTMYNDAQNWKDLIKSYTIHNDRQIKGFFNEYRWLSNFFPSEVWYEGASYPSIENAYQAAKLMPQAREQLKICSAVESKKNWKLFVKINETASQWDARKYQVMAGLVFEKFLNNLDLRQKLLDTGNKHLEESNHWHDKFWGICYCGGCQESNKGSNNLGKILTQTREYWRKQ